MVATISQRNAHRQMLLRCPIVHAACCR